MEEFVNAVRFHISELVDSLQRVHRRIVRVAVMTRGILFHICRFAGIAKRMRFRRITATARWNSSDSMSSVPDWRAVYLDSSVWEKRTFGFGRISYSYEIRIGDTGKPLTLIEGKSGKELAKCLRDFMATANPENLPLEGGTSKENMPDLRRRVIAFLTGRSRSFTWDGQRVEAPRLELIDGHVPKIDLKVVK